MRRSLLACLVAWAALTGAAHAGQAAPPLRLCADPDNLPFSTSSVTAANAGTRGLYVEIGQAVADALGRPMETVWSLTYFEKHNLRMTMLAGQCDFAVGLPAVPDFMGPAVILTRPFMSVGYAIVVRKDASISGLADLDGKRVAVQFSTPPQSLVANRDTITSATVLDPEEAMRLLAEGRVDAAFVWGPSAGYDNHAMLHDGFRVIPVEGAGMQYQAAIGFARKSKALRDQVDAVLPSLEPRIATLAAKYFLPTGPAVTLAAAETTEVAQARAAPAAAPAPAPAGPEAAPAAPAAAGAPAAQAAAAGAPPTPASAADIAAGRETFNGTCAHCHGPDAVQSERRIDLRELHHRYGDDMWQVFHTTVTNGRPAKGMPPWKDVFSEDDFKKIYAFLVTVQQP